jgi:ABC-type phosphate transport system auxiliary subunit
MASPELQKLVDELRTLLARVEKLDPKLYNEIIQTLRKLRVEYRKLYPGTSFDPSW